MRREDALASREPRRGAALNGGDHTAWAGAPHHQQARSNGELRPKAHRGRWPAKGVEPMLELARLLRARKNVLEHDGARPLRMPTSGAPPSRHCHRRGHAMPAGAWQSLNMARVLTAECASSLPWLHQCMRARRRGPPPIGLAGHSCLPRPPCWRSSPCYGRGHLMSTMHGGQGTEAAGP